MSDELVLIDEERRDGRVFLTLRGEIDLSNVADLQEHLELMVAGSGHIVIDLTGIEYLDSQGLRLLLRLSTRLAEQDVKLQLIAPRGSFAHGLLKLASIGEEIEVLDAPLS